MLPFTISAAAAHERAHDLRREADRERLAAFARCYRDRLSAPDRVARALGAAYPGGV